MKKTTLLSVMAGLACAQSASAIVIENVSDSADLFTFDVIWGQTVGNVYAQSLSPGQYAINAHDHGTSVEVFPVNSIAPLLSVWAEFELVLGPATRSFNPANVSIVLEDTLPVTTASVTALTNGDPYGAHFEIVRTPDSGSGAVLLGGALVAAACLKRRM
jgi:hypothetical protein